MDKKTTGIILAVLLIVSFFLPYLSIQGYNMNGFKMVFGSEGYLSHTKGNLMFLILLIPIGAIAALINAFADGEKGIVNWLPLIGVLYLGFRVYMDANGLGIGFGELMGYFGYGFWISLAASVLLLINNARS